MLLKSPLHFDQFNKECLFISTDISYLKFLITPTFLVAEHDSSFCFSQNCKFHILLHSETPFMEKLADLQFSFLNVDSLYFLFKFYFSKDKIILSKGLLVEMLTDAVKYNNNHKFMEQRPSVAKKRLLRKTFKNHMSTRKQRTIATQTPKNMFLERITAVIKSSFALDLMRIVDCLLDSHGQINNKQITFYCK